jgi:hypothetical protein
MANANTLERHQVVKAQVAVAKGDQCVTEWPASSQLPQRRPANPYQNLASWIWAYFRWNVHAPKGEAATAPVDKNPTSYFGARSGMDINLAQATNLP